MLIFPLSVLILQTIFRRGKVSRENTGGLTVIETVFPMIGGLFAAWLLLPHRPDFVFPVAAIAVGTHYFGFRSAYGDWANWILGGTLCAIGVASIQYGIPQAQVVPFAIAAVEVSFGLWFIWISLQKDSDQ